MTRRARLFFPFVFAVALFALYWFVRHNPGLMARVHIAREPAENVLLFIALIPVIFFAVRALDLVAFDVLVTRRQHVRAPILLREIVSIGLYLVLIAWAVSTIFHYSIRTFLATGTIVAAILGLALQETLGNLFGGIALHLEDTFEIGDVVRSGDYIGVVEAVRWRATRIRTFNNDIVIIPNSMLARERVEVFPRNNPNARVLQIGIDYHVPPATVIAILTQAASNVDGVAHELPCIARVGGFADSSVTYEIKYFMRDYAMRDRIDAEIRKAAWYALRRNGISIPFPIRAVHRYEPPAQRQQIDAEEIADLLARIDFLSPLGSDALDAIAAASRVHTYAKGETIIRRGGAGNSMFIVHGGSVAVRVDENEVARLGAGDFFGEMALLTGETRTADVVALSEVVAVEIAKDALQPVLAEHPELASAISTKVMERRDSLESARAETKEEHASVLSRIRAYFGL